MEPQRKPSKQKADSKKARPSLRQSGRLYLWIVNKEAHTLGAGVEINPELLQLLVVGRKQLQDRRAESQPGRTTVSQGNSRTRFTWAESKKAVRQGKVYTLADRQTDRRQQQVRRSHRSSFHWAE